MGLFGSDKKHKYMCKQINPSKALSSFQCGKKWGPKVEKKRDDAKHITKQCPKCEEKEEKKFKRSKYQYICPLCEKGHGEKYKSGKYADTTRKSCGDHSSDTDVSVGVSGSKRGGPTGLNN